VSLSRLLSCPEISFLEPEFPICLNVGGQLFETNVGILTRDPFSILAALCRSDSHYFTHHDEPFFFDRDWWIFRHLLAYLKSSVLPSDIDTLKELYTEATFYRLELLQKAIEDLPLDRIYDDNAASGTLPVSAVGAERKR
jgi:hypothetical protein